MRWSDVIEFLGRDPLVALFLALLVVMACFIVAALSLALWLEAQEQAEEDRREQQQRLSAGARLTLQRDAVAPPRAPGCHSRGVS